MRLQAVADKLSPIQLFIGFNIIFLLGIATPALICILNGLYEPMPWNAATITPLCIAWIAVIVAFAFLFLCLRHKGKLENLNAFLVLSGCCELIFFAFITIKAHTVPLYSHKAEESQKIIEMLKQANENPDLFRKGNFILVNMTLRMRVLHIQYKRADSTQDFYDNESMRAPFKQGACGYLSSYAQYDSLARVAYTILVNSKTQVNFGFTSKDCTSLLSKKNTATAPTPTSGQPQEVKSKEQGGTKQKVQSGVSTDPTAGTPVADKLDGSVKGLNAPMDKLQESMDRLQESLKLFVEDLKQLKDKIVSHVQPHAP